MERGDGMMMGEVKFILCEEPECDDMTWFSVGRRKCHYLNVSCSLEVLKIIRACQGPGEVAGHEVRGVYSSKDGSM